ncbi:MAG: acylphosphatase [Anaerolineales bacterium]
MSMEMETLRLAAVVDGRVQGVGFRYFVQQQAQALGLTGWVRNLRNGRVDVLAEGPRPALEALLDALRRGPRSAWVSEVKFEWQAASGEFSGFHVRPTA